MDMTEENFKFQKFPKIPRINGKCMITEKIDGTNAQIVFNENGDMIVGSKNRVITPNNDNFNFAEWAYTYKTFLFEFLGQGRWYGEWAGQGIQRNYGLDHKRFYLFNPRGFTNNEEDDSKKHINNELYNIGLDVVPILYNKEYTFNCINDTMENLRGHSKINNYHNPEGIIIQIGKSYFKNTFDNPNGKWRN